MKYLKERIQYLTEKVMSEVEELLTKKKCYKKGDKWNCDGKLQIGSNPNREVLIKNNQLIVKFGVIKGEFSVAFNQKIGRYPLHNCNNFPKEVHGRITVGYNDITSLKGFPKYVGGDIILTDNKLETLVGLPKTLNGELVIVGNPLTDLKGLPENLPPKLNIGGSKLKTLEQVPKHIKELGIHGCRELETITHILGRKDLKLSSFDRMNKKTEITALEVKCYQPNIPKEEFFSRLAVEFAHNKIDPRTYPYWPKGFLEKSVAKSAISVFKYDL